MSVFDELFDAAQHADDIFHTDPADFRGNDDEIQALRDALDRLMGASFDTVRRLQGVGLLKSLTNGKGWA